MPVSAFYSELDGQVSPSGRYELEITGELGHLGDPTPTTSSLWLIDRISGQSTKILDGTDLVFRGGEWFRDEQAVMFAVGPEFGTDLYLLDILSLQLTPLSELTGFEDVNLQEWTLSPDGTMTAVVDGQGALRVLPLHGGQATVFEGFFYNVRWQPDGGKLFYYHGAEWFDLETIDVFDTATGEIRTIATSSQLEHESVLGRPFEVAPGGGLLAMWSGEEIYWMRVPAP
jgi:Tol biopolymer transport system component